MRVQHGQHIGQNYCYHGLPPPSLSWVRVVYVDACNIERCSVDNVSFHVFAWPTLDVRKTQPIARTLWTNPCKWADVLIVRGRCWPSRKDYFRSNGVSEDILWHWAQEHRLFVVYKEGNDEIGCGDPVPAWIDMSYCVCGDLCQCNLPGVTKSGAPMMSNHQSWHHPSALRTNNINTINGYSHVFNCNCFYSRVTAHRPTIDCNKNTMKWTYCNKGSKVRDQFVGTCQT